MNSIPQVQVEYYRGFQKRMGEVFSGEVVNLESMTKHERKGYFAACRAEADADTDGYLTMVANRTQGAR